MPSPNPQEIPLSLYVHIPWCVRKCPYCDFNSHEGKVEEQAYIHALLADLVIEAPQVEGREISSIFFGGGTPSLFSGAGISQILNGVREHLSLAADCEITLEANPGTVEQARFDAYREAGVNRLSIGVQSFDGNKLKTLGRIHDPAEAIKAATTARVAGFDNFNIDLMFALPGQTPAEAVADIEQALALQPTHLSHYHLTLEANTVFAKYPPANLPDQESAWDIQDACQQRLQQADFENYEVSAWALPQRQCAHNLNYWRFGDYLGIGAGAHGKVTNGKGQIWRSAKKKSPAHYLRDVGTEAVYASQQQVAESELGFEYMLNRLRLREPLTLAEVARYSGITAATVSAPMQQAVDKGLLIENLGRWQPSELGALHLNELLTLFMPEHD